jgi:hypothetical protein
VLILLLRYGAEKINRQLNWRGTAINKGTFFPHPKTGFFGSEILFIFVPVQFTKVFFCAILRPSFSGKRGL